MTAPSRLTLDEIEALLAKWEQRDGGFSAADRAEIIDVLTASPNDVAWWQAHLITVPADVETRYRKVLELLQRKNLIDEEDRVEELRVMGQFSPMALAQRGKVFADWWRSMS